VTNTVGDDGIPEL